MAQEALIIHGGCGDLYNPDVEIEREQERAQREGLDEIIRKGWELLRRGERALDVVEKTVNLLEEHPAFNAGIGAALGHEKQVELDASIMNGDTLDCGAVANLRSIPNAVSVARSVMERTRHVLLVGEGASDFAREEGFETLPDEAFVTPYQLYVWEKKEGMSPRRGTVGAVVRDRHGSIAAGTSTGGVTRKMRGRVGDSPLIGCGTYADSSIGGASCTGYGEQIMKVVMAKSAIDLLRFEKLSPNEACKRAVSLMDGLHEGLGGIILINREGEVGAWANEPVLPRAYMTSKMEAPFVGMEMK